MIFLLLFWFAVGCMFHSYILYSWLLKVFAVGKQQNKVTYNLNDIDLPNVFIVFSVYNEERVMEQKLQSIFATSYPMDKIKVFIGSDNSSDSTNQLVDSYAAKYSQLNFTKFTDRNGKSGVINRLMQRLGEQKTIRKQDVLIFTDANVFFTTDTIFELVKHFKNPSISQVGANILNNGISSDGISHQEKSYVQRENYIKYLEGLNWGSMIGAFGACYALRADAWVQIPANYLMEDFYLSMHVLKQKQKAILELKAICYEDVSNEVEEEFKRKTRIQAGNFQNLAAYKSLLFKWNAVAFCFISHKVIRWFGPLFLIVAYISNIGLLPLHPFYKFTFLLQNLLWFSPLLDALLKRINVNFIPLRFASYFILMNIALVKGLKMYAQGIKTNAWSPTKRNV